MLEQNFWGMSIDPSEPTQHRCHIEIKRGFKCVNHPKQFKVYSGTFTFHTKNAEGIVLVTTVEAKFMVENFKEIGQLIHDQVLSRFTSDFVLETVELKKL